MVERYMDPESGTPTPEEAGEITPLSPETRDRIERGEWIEDDMAREINQLNRVTNRALFFSQVCKKHFDQLSDDLKSRYDTDVTFKNTMDAGFQLEVQALMGAVPPVITGVKPSPRDAEIASKPAPKGMEKVEVLTALGTSKEVTLPYKDEDKINYMRNILLQIEGTKDPSGGDANKELLNELYSVIIALRKKSQDNVTKNIEHGSELYQRNENLTELGGKMYRELISRLTLHSVFLQFERANDVDTVQGAVNSLTADHLNFLFRDAQTEQRVGMPVWEAFKLYESYCDDYLKRRGTGINEFNTGIIQYLADPKNGIIPPPPKQESGESKEDFADRKRRYEERSKNTAHSAQLLAERLWQVTARRVSCDKLVNEKTKKLASEKDKKSGDVEFEADASGGNFALRRVVCFNDWLYTRIKSDRLIPELTKGVDIGGADYLSQLPGQIESHFEGQLRQKYTEQGLSPEQAVDEAKVGARKIAQAFIGEDKEGDGVDEKTGKLKFKWPSGQKLNVSDILWNGVKKDGSIPDDLKEFFGEGKFFRTEARRIDFAMFSENSPMGLWAFRKLSMPDKARDALAGKSESLLRKPNGESLRQLKDTFSYQSEGQYKIKAKLAENFVNFATTDKIKETGFGKLDRMGADTFINAVARDFSLNQKEAEEIFHKTIGKTSYDGLLLGLSYFRADRGFLTFIWELLKGILKAGLSQK